MRSDLGRVARRGGQCSVGSSSSDRGLKASLLWCHRVESSRGNLAERSSITAVAPRPFFPSFLSMTDKRLSEQRTPGPARTGLLSSIGMVDLINSEAGTAAAAVAKEREEPTSLLNGAEGHASRAADSLL